MNLSYFRRTNRNANDVKNALVEQAAKMGWTNLGVNPLPHDSGYMVLLCRPEWLETLLKRDRNLIGFLPCSISVVDIDGQTTVGSGQPNVIKAITQNREIQELAGAAERQIKELIHAAAGVEPLKPKSVKLYSSTTCPYCSMEKSWLEEKGVKHEVVYVDSDQSAAEDMVNKTGQMGVPVTEVQYEEGEPDYVVGFDRSRLSQMLNVER